MKIALLCLIIAGATYIGYGLSSYYRKRFRFFKDCTSFASKLIVDINFSKTNLKEIINSNLNSYAGEFKHILNGYLNYLSSEAVLISETLLFKKNTFLNDEEKQTLFLFFKSLGRYDAENQIKEIQNFTAKFQDLQKTAELESKKYSALYIKLGLMLGILVAIILI